MSQFDPKPAKSSLESPRKDPGEQRVMKCAWPDRNGHIAHGGEVPSHAGAADGAEFRDSHRPSETTAALSVGTADRGGAAR